MLQGLSRRCENTFAGDHDVAMAKVSCRLQRRTARAWRGGRHSGKARLYDMRCDAMRPLVKDGHSHVNKVRALWPSYRQVKSTGETP